MHKEHEKAEEDLRKRDEESISLHQRLLTQKEETESTRVSFDEWKDSRELKSMEEVAERSQPAERAPQRKMDGNTRQQLSEKDKSFQKEVLNSVIKSKKELLYL